MRTDNVIPGRVVVTPNYEIEVTPPELRRYVQQIRVASPDFVAPNKERNVEGRGYVIRMEQISDRVDGEQPGAPKYDVLVSNPRAYVQGTLYSSGGQYIELGGDGVVDIRELEDFAQGVLALIGQARARGLFPHRSRRKADSRGVEITEKGRKALASAKAREGGKPGRGK